MTSRETVSYEFADSTITADVLLEDGVAQEFESLLLTHDGLNDIELASFELSQTTVNALFKRAEIQYKKYLEADQHE